MFVQEGEAIPLNCAPYAQWRTACYNKTGAWPECTWSKWHDKILLDGTKGAGCGQYDTFSKGIMVEHGKGPVVFDILTNEENPRIHGSTYTITLLDGVKIIVNQGKMEEHTSELQSHSDLVCRLLLEKKKKNNKK